MAEIAFRLGKANDARAIATLFDMANAGLIASLLAADAGENETWLDIAERMVCDPNSEIYFGHAIVTQVDSAVAGALICVKQPNGTALENFDAIAPTDRPFAYLRSRVPGGFLLRDMAVFPEYRQHGFATHMLDLAVASAYSMGHETVFAIVHESNDKLLAHYARRGLKIIDEHKVLEHPAYDAESRWLLLTCHKPEGIVGFKYTEPASQA